MITFFTIAFYFQVVFSNPFPDVPQSHWAYEAVNTLKDAGLLKGYPDGRFRG